MVDVLTLSFSAPTVMVFADRNGIFLGNLPSKVEHAAKTGWSGLSDPRLLVDDMSVHQSETEIDTFVCPDRDESIDACSLHASLVLVTRVS